VPQTPGPQPAFDKSDLSKQRLQLHGEHGSTVTPSDGPPRRLANPEIIVKTEWKMSPESPRRARLLAAIFGIDGDGA
jgi:hypothetical protein